MLRILFAFQTMFEPYYTKVFRPKWILFVLDINYWIRKRNILARYDNFLSFFLCLLCCRLISLTFSFLCKLLHFKYRFPLNRIKPAMKAVCGFLFVFLSSAIRHFLLDTNIRFFITLNNNEAILQNWKMN